METAWSWEEKRSLHSEGSGPAPPPPTPSTVTNMLSTCCCGRCLLRTGSICTAVFFMVYRLCLVAGLALAVLFFDQIDDNLYDHKKETFWVILLVALAVNGVDLILCVCLTIGVVRGRALPLLIWIVYETLNVVFLVVVIVIFMILTQFQTQFIVALVTSLVLSAFKIYLILAVVSYYQYLASGISSMTSSR